MLLPDSMEYFVENAMNENKNDRRYFSFRLAALSLVTVLMCNAPAPAYTMPVVEIGPSVLQQIMNQINTYKTEATAAESQAQDAAEYAEAAARWERTLDQYRQQLISIQAVVNDFGMPRGQELSTVDYDYLVRETCRGATGMDLTALLKGFKFSSTSDFKSQQTQICVNIRVMQNRKYNEAVAFMNETIPKMQSSLARISGQRRESNNQGNVQGVDSESLRLANDLAVQAQMWEARVKSYDAYIEIMEANQKVVAEQAMKGDTKSRVIGGIVRTSALKLALSIK
jgi:hypothetical protein